jgi:hypothetical protein
MTQFPEAKPVTSGKHHFFGYYDKFPWSGNGRYLLALETDFIDRQPTPDDAATIGLIDTEEGNRWQPLDTTTAWNWQQSTMLQWLASDPDRKIHYNQRQGDRFVAVIRDIETGETRTLPRPIYTQSRDGKWAISLNFARLHQTRPGYGYDGLPDPFHDEMAPSEDGVYHLDLASGETKLLLSLADAVQFHPKPSMEGAKHWFNHAQINTDSTRVAVLHRWQGPEYGHWFTRMLTMNPDGSDLYALVDHDFCSHYDWFSPTQVLAWARHEDIGMRYFLYTDRTGEIEIIGEEVFSVDGHCSYSPDRRWMMTDTYPDEEHIRTLMLYELASGTRIDIGRFYAPPELTGPIRCDLHPRWNRDGRKVCLDSAHEGQRQVYVIDVSSIVDA